jgi:hypothetical protein
MAATEKEFVRTLEASGWLRPAQVLAELKKRYGKLAPTGLRTIYDWIQRPVDPLRAERVGGRLLIHRSELMSWLQRQGSPRPTEPAGDPAA